MKAEDLWRIVRESPLNTGATQGGAVNPDGNVLAERALRHGAIVEELEVAGIDYARKIHRESACGEDGLHWAECERFSRALAALARNLDWEQP